MVQDDYNSTKRCVKSEPQTIVLVHLFYFNIVVVNVDVHVIACVVGYDRQSIVRAIEGNPDRLSIANPIGEDHNRQGIEQVALDRAVEGTGSVDGRVTRGTEKVLRIFVDLKSHLPLCQAILNLLQPDAHDLFHISQREGAEDNDLIDSVNELWWEMPAYSSHHQLLGLRFHRTFAHITEVGCAEVACHDDDSISEIDHSTLAVSEPSIVEDLQE